MFVSPGRKKKKAGATFPSVESFLFPDGVWPEGNAHSWMLHYALGGRGFILFLVPRLCLGTRYREALPRNGHLSLC